MTQHIVISGAGPAGLFAAISILNRNKDDEPLKYSVEVVDGGDDFGLYDEGFKVERSWMIGLSTHGLTALGKIPGLVENYISKVGVRLSGISLHVAGRSFFFDNSELGETYNVDRNLIVAQLSKFLHDKYDNDPRSPLKMHWNHKVLYIDGDLHQVVARATGVGNSQEGSVEQRFSYDYLLGCDGARSPTRSAFHLHDRSFESTYTSTLGSGKSAHIDMPPGLDPNSMHVLIDLIPGGNSFCTVEKGGKLNVLLSYDVVKGVDDDFKSKDPKVVANYLRQHMTKSHPRFAETFDFDETSRQFAAQELNSTYHVHCNTYHNTALRAILVGDAAHATLPFLGQGMNQAFVDVQVLNELLDQHEQRQEHKGDESSLCWTTDVSPSYSEARVKKGTP